MRYRCVTCDQEFPDIPAGAVQLTPRHRGRRAISYRLTDGSIHSLHQLSLTFKQHQHLHKKNPKPDCEFCFPPPVMAEPEPPVQTESLQEVQPPVQAPVPEQMAEVKPEVAEIEGDESELTSITTLSAAFNRIRK